MSFRPFQNEFADHRVVVIPADLDDERRTRFVTKVAAAVKQQGSVAGKSDAILRVSGEIEQREDRIVIPHEPAAPGDPSALASPPEPPESPSPPSRLIAPDMMALPGHTSLPYW